MRAHYMSYRIILGRYTCSQDFPLSYTVRGWYFTCRQRTIIYELATDDGFTFNSVRYYFCGLGLGIEYHVQISLNNISGLAQVHASICNYSALLNTQMTERS